MSDEVRTLPLWKDWIDKRGHKMTYGDSVSSEELEAALSLSRKTMAFGMATNEIRNWFRAIGLNFTSRGQNLSGYVISEKRNNPDELERLGRRAIANLTNAVILGSATTSEGLSQVEAQRLEKATENSAIRLALLSQKMPVKIAKAE